MRKLKRSSPVKGSRIANGKVVLSVERCGAPFQEALAKMDVLRSRSREGRYGLLGALF